MNFGSVCSGIEAASVAWTPLGWKALWFSEIEAFPAAVLRHHYQNIPNLGDMTTLPNRVLSGEVEAPSLLCGGTPCQAFSVAGLRKSLGDARGNLSLIFCEIANAIDTVRDRQGNVPSIIFWENVPGVLSTKDNAFGCFLAGLAGEDDPLEPAGGKWTNAGYVSGPARTVAWRVLDAQYFGVAQRRRRVFVVASARNDFDPAAVLFEREGVRRDTAPSREAGQVAPTIPSRSTAGGGLGTDFDCDGGVISIQWNLIGRDAGGPVGVGVGVGVGGPMFTLTKADVHGVAHTLRSEGFDASEDGTGRGTPLVPVTTTTLTSNGDAHSGFRDEHGLVPVAFDTTQITSAANRSNPQPGDACHLAVRRLTVEECEFLQGFPRGYTKIPWRNKPASECPDGPRYKALGNSWAVPVVRWIGQRIDLHLKLRDSQ